MDHSEKFEFFREFEMKRIYLIGGTMGVGKTSVCQRLKKELKNAVFLDGDWCWDANPFQVNAETKRIVIDNICHLLNNFIHCSVYDNVIFCWVMHEQSIINDILSNLDLTNCDVKTLSLICNRDELAKRLKKDIKEGIRQEDVITRSIERLPLYAALNTVKVDVSDLSVEQTVGIIESL